MCHKEAKIEKISSKKFPIDHSKPLKKWVIKKPKCQKNRPKICQFAVQKRQKMGPLESKNIKRHLAMRNFKNH